MSNIIKLSGGGFLYNDFGKYSPNLTFLFTDKKICSEVWEVTEESAIIQKARCIECGIVEENIHLEHIGFYEEEPFRNSIGEIVQPRKKIRISWVENGKFNPHYTTDFTDMNIEKDGNMSVLYGNFFVSKKGKNCFRILDRENAEHQLVRIDWGGCFNSTRGHIPEKMEKASLYHRRASSNGGGTGYTYVVLPKDWQAGYTEDDI